MARKEYIGLSLQGRELRIAVVEAVTKQIAVKRLFTTELPLDTGTGPSAGPGESDAQPEVDDIEDLLGIKSAEPEKPADTDDEWDMTEDGVGDGFRADTNELVLANLLTGFNPKSAQVALTVPAGQSLFQIFADADYRKRKKKDIQELIHDRLFSTYGRDITANNYAHTIRDADGALLLSSMEGSNALLNLVDMTTTVFPGKLAIRDIKPEELYLVALVRANYQILDTEYTVLIHILDRQTHIIILHGTKMVGILPVIPEGSKSSRVMKTIFSKLLFELDRGQLPTIDRIILTGDDLKGKALSFLEEQFMEVRIGRLELDPMKVTLPSDFAEDPTPYASAIAAAWSATGRDSVLFPKISLIPAYVLTRQAVFKLAWHGYILLLLIAGSPFMFNQAYQSKAARYEELKTEVSTLTAQISESRILSTVVDQLNAEIGMLTVNTNLLDTLAKNTQLWSYTLSMLNARVAEMRGVWIQNIQYDDRGLIIQGYSLNRERIPMVSNLFAHATIQQVLEVTERTALYYEFAIQVHKIAPNETLTSPLPVEPPPLDIRGLETGGTGGIIQN